MQLPLTSWVPRDISARFNAQTVSQFTEMNNMTVLLVRQGIGIFRRVAKLFKLTQLCFIPLK